MGSAGGSQAPPSSREHCKRGARREASSTASEGSKAGVLEGPTAFVQPSENKRVAPHKYPAPSEFLVPTGVTEEILTLAAFMKIGDRLGRLYPSALLLPTDVSRDKTERLHPQQQPLSLPSSLRRQKVPRPCHGSFIQGCSSSASKKKPKQVLIYLSLKVNYNGPVSLSPWKLTQLQQDTVSRWEF